MLISWPKQPIQNQWLLPRVSSTRLGGHTNVWYSHLRYVLDTQITYENRSASFECKETLQSQSHSVRRSRRWRWRSSSSRSKRQESKTEEENDRKLIVKSSLRCASFKVRVNIINFDQYVRPVMSTRTRTHTLALSHSHTVVHSFVSVLSSLLSLSHCSHSQSSLSVPCGPDRVWLSRLSIGI